MGSVTPLSRSWTRSRCAPDARRRARTPTLSMTPRLKRPTMTVSLRRLLPAASFVGWADVIVTDVTEHSSECAPGMVFAAIAGTHVKGTDFIPEALARGASAVITDQPLAAIRVPQCIVPDVRRAYAETCHAVH